MTTGVTGPDAGLTVMGLAAIIALAIGVSGYLSSDSQISATRGFLLVCTSSLMAVAALGLTDHLMRPLVAAMAASKTRQGSSAFPVTRRRKRSPPAKDPEK